MSSDRPLRTGNQVSTIPTWPQSKWVGHYAGLSTVYVVSPGGHDCHCSFIRATWLPGPICWLSQLLGRLVSKQGRAYNKSTLHCNDIIFCEIYEAPS